MTPKHSLILLAATSIFFGACGKPSTETPVPKTQNSYQETEVSVDKLFGAYINAGQDTPIIVIVPGSGPTDRDSNNGSMKSNALKFLAQGLADNDISSIRVDKRGLFASHEAGDPNAVTVDIYAEDYRRWASKAIELSGQKCAYLLGHSEGGLMVTAAALEQDNICGVITVAAPGRRLSDVLREQLTSNPANAFLMKDAEGAIAALEKGERVDVSDFNAALKPLFYPAVQDFLISVFAVDPAEMLARLTVPSLVIQGEHDIQVSVEDGQRLADKSGAKLVLIPKMNHVLKPAPKNKIANALSYNSPNKPIDAAVTEAITGFIFKNG
jgi:pimeloyl-ACP methyl ester carboxylesterase